MRGRKFSFLVSPLVVCGVLLGSFMGSSVENAMALPWDIDMYRQQSYQANEMVRNPVKGTVPYGSKPMTLTTEEAGKQLQNPVAFEKDSLWRGKRLWSANCLTCHGNGKEKGPVAAFLPVPNLIEDFYKGRTDGYVFGVIHNGGAAMPRYGFKFSEREHWDLVNYVRFLQGKDAPGFPR